MKFSIIIILLGFSFFSYNNYITNKEGSKKYEYILLDGELLSPLSIVEYPDKSELITKELYPDFSSAILRSFETTSNNAMDFVIYANSISENRGIGYWSVLPNAWKKKGIISFPVYAGLDEDNFIKYYHSIFRNKAARSILFDKALEIVCELCNKYPSDFKKSVLKELNQLSVFSNSISSIKNFDNDKTNDYWKGFIYRRYLTDKIPVSEIKNAIIKAQNKIKAIDVSNQPDAMFEININKQISLLYTIDRMILYSHISKKEEDFKYDIAIKNVKYLKDATGEFYFLSGTKNSLPVAYLYDKNLNKIE